MPQHDDWVYLAGFLDGEGCFMARRTGKAYRRSTARPLPRIVTNQRCGWVVEDLASLFGEGMVYDHFNGTTRMKVWQVSNIPGCRYLLESLIPYMRLKKRQAELLLMLSQPERLGFDREEHILKLLKRYKQISHKMKVSA